MGASGLVNIVADILPGTALWNLAGVALGILVLPALYLVQRRAVGRPGLIAASFAQLGLIGIVGLLFAQAALFPEMDPKAVAALTAGRAGMFIFASVILYVLGVLAFAATSWRPRVHPRPALALWAIGTAPTVAAIALPPWVMTVAEAIAGAGIVWLCAHLWRHAQAAAEPR
jgi:hypothetical protein